jgi:hypothetical protein
MARQDYKYSTPAKVIQELNGMGYEVNLKVVQDTMKLKLWDGGTTIATTDFLGLV